MRGSKAQSGVSLVFPLVNTITSRRERETAHSVISYYRSYATFGNNRLERLEVPVCRVRQRIAQRNVELGKVHSVQEHINPAQVIGGEVDFLTKEALFHIFQTQDFRELQQQRT